jgi:hypothetical protein
MITNTNGLRSIEGPLAEGAPRLRGALYITYAVVVTGSGSG